MVQPISDLAILPPYYYRGDENRPYGPAYRPFGRRPAPGYGQR